MFQLVESNYLVKSGCCKLRKCKHICLCILFMYSNESLFIYLFFFFIFFFTIIQNEEYQLKNK